MNQFRITGSVIFGFLRDIWDLIFQIRMRTYRNTKNTIIIKNRNYNWQWISLYWRCILTKFWQAGPVRVKLRLSSALGATTVSRNWKICPYGRDPHTNNMGIVCEELLEDYLDGDFFDKKLNRVWNPCYIHVLFPTEVRNKKRDMQAFPIELHKYWINYR